MPRGSKPKGKVRILWSSEFAYAIGLLTADGCLSKDGRHIDLTSKDRVQIALFKKCLNLTTKIGKKYSGSGNLAYHTQFGDVLFYRFLVEIGLTPAKSKTISAVSIPEKYFLDFVRGYFDGDGCSYSYYDPVFRNSFRFRISFTSASLPFFEWLQAHLHRQIGIGGHIERRANSPYVQLRYSKREAMMLVRAMYYSAQIPFLRRKRLKIQRSMRIIERGRSGETGRRAVFRTQ